MFNISPNYLKKSHPRSFILENALPKCYFNFMLIWKINLVTLLDEKIYLKIMVFKSVAVAII